MPSTSNKCSTRCSGGSVSASSARSRASSAKDAKTNEGRENLLDGLGRAVYIKQAQGQNLYTIGYTHRDRAKATRVVQSLLSIFVESGLEPKSPDFHLLVIATQKLESVHSRPCKKVTSRTRDAWTNSGDINAPPCQPFAADEERARECPHQYPARQSVLGSD